MVSRVLTGALKMESMRFNAISFTSKPQAYAVDKGRGVLVVYNKCASPTIGGMAALLN